MHSSDDQITVPALRVEVLGPVRVFVDGAPVDVRGERRVAVLAVLAMAGGRVVPFDALIDAVWGEASPDNARQALHSLLSRIRGQLGPHADRLERDGNGYRLRLERGELDVADVRARVAEARATAGVDPAAAAELLARALDSWRGRPLADLAAVDAMAADVVALTELRLGLEEELLEAELAAGRLDDLVERSATAAAAHPTREARQLLLMRVLARAGRSADALRAGNEYRRRLAEETGLEPTGALALLESRIAAGELTAEAAAPQPDEPPPGTEAAAPRPTGLRPVTAAPPQFRTPLLGRDRELGELASLLAEQHLVAVVGPPGVGKTRLAAEVATAAAASDPTAVTFVSLAAVDATTSLSATVAGALGIRVGPGQTPMAAAIERVAVGPHLLALDNCEHVLGAVRDLLAELLAACPQLTVLLTSRIPTGLPGECVVRVSPLPVGDDSPAIRLFLERAARVRPGFEVAPGDEAVIGEIVRRLDGLPMAIELAAARLSTLSLRDLAARLDTALDLLGGPATGNARHRTLRSTLDWSYQLLDEPHQLLLRHLAEFADGVDLSGVEWVAAATELPMGGTVELAALVDASLVQAELEGDARYRLLETVRALGRDRQRDVPGERDRARALMVRWACQTAAEIETMCSSAAEPVGDRRLRREVANLRAAHHAALESGDLDAAIAITVSLDMPASLRDLPEIWSWALRLSEWPGVEDHPRRIEVLGAAAEAAWLQGDLDRAERLATDGLAIGEVSGRCLHCLATVSMFRGSPGRAVELWREAGELAPTYRTSAALGAGYAGQIDLARDILGEAMAWASTAGSPSDLAWAHYVSAEATGDDAVAAYTLAIDLSRQAGASFIEGVAMVSLAARLARSGEEERALDIYDQVIRYWQRTGSWTQQWTTLRNLAVLLERRGDLETAALLVASAAHAAEASAVLDIPAGEVPAAPPLPRGEVVSQALAAIARQRNDRSI